MEPLENIVARNDEDTQTARENNLTPYVPEKDSKLDVKDKFWKSLPELGYFVPKGWTFERDLTVKSITAKAGFGYGFGKQGPTGKRVIREFKKVL